jgi:poly-gamma-glutamate capsule biosynthesis protein CapA/YwtB (metallophosphatase superfamily)
LKSSLELIRRTKNENDIVVVSIHAGAEGTKAKVLPPGEEFDFGERRGNINLFAKKAIEAGADIVFGHGPHVLRKIEVYKKKIIAYSLGNFATTPGFNLMDEQKYGLILLAKINFGGDLVEAQIVPTVQNLKAKCVELDSSHFAIRSIQKLSQKKLVGHDGKIL